MSEWLPIADQPAFDFRPFRQFILVEGWEEHSGAKWARAYWGIAHIRRDDQPDCLMGYRREDVERIMQEGGMSAITSIRYWMPAQCPYYPRDVRV